MPRVYTVVPDETFTHFVQQPAGTPSCPQLEIFKISGDLYFGAVNHVEETLFQHLADHPDLRFLLLRLQGVNNCDISGIRMLETVRLACQQRGGDLYLMKVQKPVLEMMHTTGFYDELGPDHFLTTENAAGHLFYRVLDPVVCIYECNIQFFAECQNLPKYSYSQPQLTTQVPEVKSVPEISSERVWDQLNNGSEPPIIIDVRQPREYERGHLPQAKLSPLSRLLTNIQGLPYDSHIILVCQTGKRSQQAAQLLQNEGYTNVAMVQNGMRAWKNRHLPEQVEPLSGYREMSGSDWH